MSKSKIQTNKLTQKFKGRGTDQNPANRFDKIEYVKDETENFENSERPKTQYFEDTSKSVITFNDSPDINFNASLNIYRGCEHGCIYCYARPSHEFLSLSSGLDFETKIFIKYKAPEQLYKALSSKKWKPQIVMLSSNTDCYQPVEKKLKLTRSCLEIFHKFHNPVSIVTKNKMITRDIDILQEMAKLNTVSVVFSITSLDNRLISVMEPQTSKPHLKFEAAKKLNEAGIPTGILIAPVIPGLTDSEIPEILNQAADAGVKNASYIMLRLPFGNKELFINWLEKYFPDRKEKIINKLKDLFDGKLYKSDFHLRGRGEGPYAGQVADIFKITCKKLGINEKSYNLTVAHFKNAENRQMNLFN